MICVIGGNIMGNINICKILKGHEDMELYTDHFNMGEFEKSIPKGTPVMCSKTLEEPSLWILQRYSRKKDNKHYVKHYNIYTKSWQESPFKYIIPFDKFDPHNIEESLKYNIQVW